METSAKAFPSFQLSIMGDGLIPLAEAEAEAGPAPLPPPTP